MRQEVTPMTEFVFVIHYHRVTGEIRNWGSDDGATESFNGPDYAIAHFDAWQDVDPTRHKIDVVTQTLAEQSPAERDAHMVPQVKAAIAGELAATDQFMMPDRPLSDNARAAWRAYRQALRDLDGTAAHMLQTWPARPDGADPVAFLKSRLKETTP
jgi:hypothetical protein